MYQAAKPVTYTSPSIVASPYSTRSTIGSTSVATPYTTMGSTSVATPYTTTIGSTTIAAPYTTMGSYASASNISAPVVSSSPYLGGTVKTISSAPMATLSAPTAKVISALPTQIIAPTTYTEVVPVVSEPASVISSAKPLSREEMIARGILLQAGPSGVEAPMLIEEAQAPWPDQGFLAVFQGLQEAPAYQSHHFDSTKWQVVQPREDDIIIVTAYKSGTTWMQQIVAEILFQGQEKPASIGDMSPWVDLRVPPAEVLGPMVEGQTWRRFLKTHMPADAFLPYFRQENKYIYVARDGRDAFMSLMNHYEKGNDAWYGALNGSPGLVGDPLPTWQEMKGDVVALFDMWLNQGWPTHPDEADGWPFWSYFKNVKTWWSLAFGEFAQGNIYFVHFNNLKTDLDGEMRKIADFLQVPVNEEVWSGCVTACTFDEMKKNAEVIAPLNGALWEGGAQSFIFKGTNSRWKGVLTPDQVAAYEEKANAELGEDCAIYMATGMMPVL